MQNVVPDLYSCDKNCTSKSLTAEHISTVTKQHRFKRLPGNYTLKWMTGSSLWRDTVTITCQVSSGWEGTEQSYFTAYRQLLAQSAQMSISRGKYAKVPLPHLRKQNTGLCIDHRCLLIPMCWGRISLQPTPSVCTAESKGNALVQLTKWSHYPHQSTYIFTVFHFNQHLVVKKNELSFLRCK